MQNFKSMNLAIRIVSNLHSLTIEIQRRKHSQQVWPTLETRLALLRSQRGHVSNSKVNWLTICTKQKIASHLPRTYESISVSYYTPRNVEGIRYKLHACTNHLQKKSPCVASHLISFAAMCRMHGKTLPKLHYISPMRMHVRSTQK